MTVEGEEAVALDDPTLVALRGLAEEAGITTVWQDYRGVIHTVSARTLRALLGALELPCVADQEIAASRSRLAAETRGQLVDTLPPLVTALVGAPVALPVGSRFAGKAWRLTLDGDARASREGRFAEDGVPIVDPIDRFGYHRLEVDDEAGHGAGAGSCAITLAVAPSRCYGVRDVLEAAGRDAGERPWGISTQLYSIAQRGDGGLGSYASLAALATRAAQSGASALAISPVHAMFSADLHRFSPYGPSTRLLFNVLHVDPRAVLGDAAGEDLPDPAGLSEPASALEAHALVDWVAASRARLALLRALFDRLVADSSLQALRDDFANFRREGGETLESHARFEALHAHLVADDTGMLSGWRHWPAKYRDPHGDAVQAFAHEHADDVAFHAFLQWQAARQLDAAHRAAKEGGMTIGIVADLAVGADGDGSQAWSRQRDMLIGLSVGAPPDLLNALGQSWGLAAFSPRSLKSAGFAPWIEMLRAAFAHAGGIRIDHVLGLVRMWLVPDGAHAIEGAYLRYPFDDLLRLVALESWRHHAIVIGEDLGTVPEGLPEKLAAAGLLGIRVLWFERQWQVPGQPFRTASEWSDAALAVTTTHDLPTTAGWWLGRDIDWRARLALFGEHSSEVLERAGREADRRMLWAMLCESGAAHGAEPPPEHPPIAEALRHVGMTPAPLAIAPIEDVIGLVEQPNLPGTVSTHPNWRMRLPADVDALFDRDEVRARLAAFDEGRRRR